MVDASGAQKRFVDLSAALREHAAELLLTEFRKKRLQIHTAVLTRQHPDLRSRLLKLPGLLLPVHRAGDDQGIFVSTLNKLAH